MPNTITRLALNGMCVFSLSFPYFKRTTSPFEFFFWSLLWYQIICVNHLVNYLINVHYHNMVGLKMCFLLQISLFQKDNKSMYTAEGMKLEIFPRFVCNMFIYHGSFSWFYLKWLCKRYHCFLWCCILNYKQSPYRNEISNPAFGCLCGKS